MRKEIIAAIDATFAVAKRKPEFLYWIRLSLDPCQKSAAISISPNSFHS